jgi:molecular chaperone HtpG
VSVLRFRAGAFFRAPLHFLFSKHVGYPFNLTGILYFPKGSDLQIQKDKIQLYQNQVYVTDNVEGIVPEFLTMLKVLSILQIFH